MPVEVVRKDIKNLHVAVYPPAGRVRVATPLRLDDDAVRVAVTGKGVGFGLFETLAILGRERCLERIDRALAML